MEAGTDTTVDLGRRVKDAYVGMLKKRQLSFASWPPGGPEPGVGDPLADRTKVEHGPMTTWLVFPEKDHLALKHNEQVVYADDADLVSTFVHPIGLGCAGEHPGRPEAGVVSVGEFLDSWASLKCGEWSPSPQSEIVYMYGLGEVPEGTEHFSFPQSSEAAKLSVDWDRWHDLRDIVDKRALTVTEQLEYQRFARIVALLDAEAARAADVALGGLVNEHERVIASIRRLTTAVRAAAEKR